MLYDDSAVRKIFKLGDIDYIALKATVTSEVYVVSKATYELVNSSDEVEASGSCEINGLEFKALISPKALGDYTLRFCVEIPPLKKQPCVAVRVVEV